jgi:hypothetical protein
MNKLEKFIFRNPRKAAALIVFTIISVVSLLVWSSGATRGVSIAIIAASTVVYGFYRWVLAMIEGE